MNEHSDHQPWNEILFFSQWSSHQLNCDAPWSEKKINFESLNEQMKSSRDPRKVLSKKWRRSIEKISATDQNTFQFEEQSMIIPWTNLDYRRIISLLFDIEKWIPISINTIDLQIESNWRLSLKSNGTWNEWIYWCLLLMDQIPFSIEKFFSLLRRCFDHLWGIFLEELVYFQSFSDRFLIDRFDEDFRDEVDHNFELSDHTWHHF